MSLLSAISTSTGKSWRSVGSNDSRSTAGRSQLYWKVFRREVLAPHHVRIVDSISGQTVPESIVAHVDTNRKTVGRFAKQREDFRKQVANGKGFGSSVLFPQEVLPSLDAQPFLSRCMVPSFSEEALPEKRIGKAQTKSRLSIPRPGLGCGFSASAFGPKELEALPSHLLATGTTVHFDTGSISSGTALYCPFLTFERAFNQNEHAIDIASNQCAVDGAWGVRALQMLYAKAKDVDADAQFDSPIAFSCCIDNDIAVLFYHWVDHAQTYCMAPMLKFELTKDDHFDHFLLWIEGIGQWAINFLLPEVKKATTLLRTVSSPPELHQAVTPYIAKPKEDDSLLPALKTNYGHVPWRYDDDGFSPVSSSTASWGSPMVNEAMFAKFEYPIVVKPRSVCSDSNLAKVRFDVPESIVKPIMKSHAVPLPALPSLERPIAEPAYEANTELVIKRRLGHAMDEIQDLQAQLIQLKQELSGSTMGLQNELSGLRKTVTCVMRSNKVVTQRSPIRTRADQNAWVKSEHRLDIQKSIALGSGPVVTTPTEPRPSMLQKIKPRAPSNLQNCLTLDTNVSAVVSMHSAAPITAIDTAIDSPVDQMRSPITIFSPTIINIQNNHGLEDISTLERVPNPQKNLWSPVVATHMLSALVPSTMLRVIILGVLLDYCMMAFTQKHTPTVTVYLSHLLENGVY